MNPAGLAMELVKLGRMLHHTAGRTLDCPVCGFTDHQEVHPMTNSPQEPLPPRVAPETFRSERRFLAGRTRLEMPVLPYDSSRPILVTAGSPRELRKAVEVYGYAIFRERSYDFPLASASDLGRQEAWLIPAPRLAAVSFVAAGAVSFEPFPEGWELRWMYLHPYARGRQAIDQHWSLFTGRYGSFTVQHPIEPAAKALLQRVGWSPPTES